MASPNVSDRLFTADEFYELPDPDQGGKMELIEGRVVVEMPPGGEHSGLTSLLVYYLTSFVLAQGLGKVVNDGGFRIAQGPDTVLAPDVAFIPSAAKLPRTYIPGVPALAIEVVSPHDRNREVLEKVERYLAAGVHCVWVVRPTCSTVTVHLQDRSARIVGAGGTLTSDDAGFSIEGFALAIDDLFA
jgi:Uma2 family endonuclease